MPKRPAAATRAQALLAFLEQRLTGTMRRTYADALTQITQSLDTAAVEALLAKNDVTGALKLVADASGPARETLRAGFRTAINEAGLETVRRDAPKLVRMPTVTFGASASRAAASLKRLELQFFPTLFNEQARALRKVWTRGLRDGINPRQLARDAQQYVGLTSYDVDLVNSFHDALASGRYSDALNRTLRDKRFDATLKAARDGKLTLSAERIADMSTRYREQLHRWRAETWTRTATINAAREGQLASWLTMSDDPALAEANLVAMKTWHTTRDGRERAAHAAADGTVVPLKERFPVDSGVMTPGQGVYNCRCTFSVSFEEATRAQAPRIPRRPDELNLTDEELQRKRKRERAIARKQRAVTPPPPLVPMPTPPSVTPPITVVDPLAARRAAQRARAAARREARRGAPTPPPTATPSPTSSAATAVARSDDELVRGARDAIFGGPEAAQANAQLKTRQRLRRELKALHSRLSMTSYGTPEYSALNARYKTVNDALRDANADLYGRNYLSADARRKNLASYMRDVFEEEARATGRTLSNESKFIFRESDSIYDSELLQFRERQQQTTEFFNSFFPRFSSEDSPIPVRVTRSPDGRAFANGNMVAMAARSEVRSWVHELAHVIEYNYAKPYQWGDRLRAARAASKTTTTLPGYDASERFFKGRFFNEYMGKVYEGSNRHTEMFSVALETLWKDPKELLDKDPELFDELIKLLRNLRRR